MSNQQPRDQKKRPEFRNIHFLHDLPNYRLPLAGIVSILHRISGLLMFLLLPLLVWLFDLSLTSEDSFGYFQSIFAYGLDFFPAWLLKLVLLALIWAFLHHLFAGVRFLLIDTCHHFALKTTSRNSAKLVLIASLSLTVLLAAKLFGLY